MDSERQPDPAREDHDEVMKQSNTDSTGNNALSTREVKFVQYALMST